MIAASIFLVLLGCGALVMGVQESSIRVICVSIGFISIASAALVISMRRRSAARNREDAATVAEDWPWQLFLAAQPSAAPPASMANPCDGSPAPPAASPDPKSALPLPFGPTVQVGPWSTVEPALDLMEPGPGVHGPLRRRPLVGSQTPRPTPAVRSEDRGPCARRSTGDEWAAASRPRSAAVGPQKSGEGPRGRAGPKARGPAGPSTARSRAPGTAAAKNAAGTAGPSATPQPGKAAPDPPRRPGPPRKGRRGR